MNQMTSLERQPPEARFEPELDRLCRIAAWAGYKGRDQAPLSYTAVMIAFLLAEDRVSKWFQEFAKKHGIKSRAIFDAKKCRTAAAQEDVLKRASTGELPQTNVLYSGSSNHMFRLAAKYAANPSSPQIGVRHLMAAYALDTPEYHRDQLAEWRLIEQASREVFRNSEWALRLLGYLAEEWPDEPQWAELRTAALKRRAQARDGLPPFDEVEHADQSFAALARTGLKGTGIAGLTPDNPFGNAARADGDPLDVEKEVVAFAQVAASNAAVPPLSIGVFGDWGSGKTYFMTRMHSHVERLANEAKEDGLIHKGIVQIRFNAWHYIETNLWASLVDFIFSELDRWMHEDPTAKGERDLFERLSTAQELKIEAIEHLIATRQQRKDAEQRLEDARTAHETAVKKREEIQPAELWKKACMAWWSKKENKAAFNDVMKRLGLAELAKSAQDVAETFRQLDEQKERAGLLWRSIGAQAGRWHWIAVMAVIAFVLPAGVLGLQQALAGETGWLKIEWVKEIHQGVLGFSSMVASVGGVLGLIASRGSKALSKLEEVRGQIEEELQKRTPANTKDVEEKEKAVARTRLAMEQAQAAVTEASRRADEARREFAEGSARARLSRFIRQKVVSGDYAKHLGIIASIRKDFGQLAELMLGQEADAGLTEEYKRAMEMHRIRARELFKKLMAESRAQEPLRDVEMRDVCIQLLQLGRKPDAAKEPPARTFKRIVLYIDDLDRCPANRVVEVLQAVHLLLFFPLFVVVVAVDARWLSRSLEEQYPNLLVGEEERPRRARPLSQARRAVVTLAHGEQVLEEPARVRSDSAAPQDYLEKIFQIPYWVRPMEADASSKYVESIAKPRPLAKASAAREKSVETNGEVRKTPETPGKPGPTNGEMPGNNDKGTPGVGRVDESDRGLEETEEKQRAEDEHAGSVLTLSKAEIELMAKLAPFVGRSPRRGLRFVNTYRLIKAAHGSPAGEDGEAIGAANFAVIGQLAIVCGAPRLAREYLSCLLDAEEPGLTLRQVRERLARRRTIVESPEWPNLRGVLDGLGEALKGVSEEEREEALAALRQLAPVAMRYSFTPRR